MTSNPSICGLCGSSRRFGEPPYAQIVESMRNGAEQTRVVYFACQKCAAERALALRRLREQVTGLSAETSRSDVRAAAS